jgi:hypothetical protein
MIALNAFTRRASIAMSSVALLLPLGFGLTGSPQPEARGTILVPIVMLVFCGLTLLNALNCYIADLNYYSANSIEKDSGIEMHVRIIGGAAGRKRLLLYYPLTFFGASFGAVFSMAFILYS